MALYFCLLAALSFLQKYFLLKNESSTHIVKHLNKGGITRGIYQRNLQLLLIEIYKTVNNLNPSFMAEVFITNVVPYNLRGSTNLVLPKARTNLYGIDTVRFVGQKLWQSVPKEIKESQSLDIFKRNIKAILLDCSCKLCKSYIANLGFL